MSCPNLTFFIQLKLLFEGKTKTVDRSQIKLKLDVRVYSANECNAKYAKFKTKLLKSQVRRVQEPSFVFKHF